MKVLELFSGIGGMHLALKDSGVDGEIVASIDINPTANKVYAYNFPNTHLLNRNIQSLTPKYINELNVDTILMSPPCQPFTRNGLKEDVKDPRTDSFIHLLSILPQLNIQYILIENVKGFETSEMRNILLKSLQSSSFSFQEFILSPTQFGVPNTRHRYYCLAKRFPEQFEFEMTKLVLESLPEKHQQQQQPCLISKVLENDADVGQYIISDEILRKRVTSLDICHCNSARSCCFTKAYGRYVTGTGSVYSNKTKEEVDSVFEELKNYEQSSSEYIRCIKQLKLRFFTPREVCRLMCFPEHFDFPSDISDRQKYMLLGNSINIKVVSTLIDVLYR